MCALNPVTSWAVERQRLNRGSQSMTANGTRSQQSGTVQLDTTHMFVFTLLFCDLFCDLYLYIYV